VSLFLVLFDLVLVAMGGFTVGVAMSGVVAFTVGGVAVLLVELLGFCPLVALAGGRNKEQSGSSGGEKRGRFHPGADVADRPPMASELSRQSAAINALRGLSNAGGSTTKLTK
jgi:hypothetical protein